VKKYPKIAFIIDFDKFGGNLIWRLTNK